MNKIIYLITISFLIGFLDAGAQNIKNIRKIGSLGEIADFEPVVCKGTNDVNHHFVPAKTGSRSSQGKPIDFSATYTPTTPQMVKDMFDQFLFPTLSNTFSSNIPIKVNVIWGTAENPNTLAAAGPTTIFRGSIGLPLQESWYPIALAEKILDRQINDPNEADIEVTINSNQDWYLDFNNPAAVGNRQDLASTLLHELYHGLGFVVARDVNDNDEGFIQFFGNPYAYARYMENGMGTSLLDFAEGSVPLGDQLTGNDLFFQSPSLQGENRARLYAPIAFAAGSSTAHLDETTYNMTPSSLMTPTSSRGEVERAAGIADDLLYDLGWNYTSIVHSPPAPVENVNENFTVEASIVSDNEVDESSLTLVYFVGRQGTRFEVPMTKGSDGMFTADIPATGDEFFVLYYITVNDMNGKTYTNPGEAPNKLLYRYDFAIDNTAPEITHEPVTTISSVDNSFDLVAEVTDQFVGVESVNVEFSINKGPLQSIPFRFEPLNEFTDSLYLATVVLPDGSLKESDLLDYRIVAIDKAAAKNRTTNPATGFHSINVETVSASIDKYFNSFNSEAANEDFFVDGFEITTPPGFSDPAVHSMHPYPNAGENRTIDWTYQLKTPVKIKADDPFIRFREIVLVEIGDPGTRFGTTEFWDYVIVEGQKLGDRTWTPFLDGYDSGANPIWANTYRGGIPTGGQDSNAEGTPALFRGRSIDMTRSGDFEPGDEIFIRFRMFSDPFAVGWGWAIDDLTIQESTVAVTDYLDETSFIAFPNPMGKELNIALDLKKNAPKSLITLSDIYGRVIHSEYQDLDRNKNNHIIDVAQYPSGVYLLSIRFNKDDVITKKVIK